MESDLDMGMGSMTNDEFRMTNEARSSNDEPKGFHEL
jgi:hypothetical protein